MNSSLIANQKPYNLSAFWSILIYLLAFFIMLSIFGGIYSVIGGSDMGTLNNILVNQILMTSSVLVITIFAMRVIDNKPWRVLGYAWQDGWINIVLGFLIAFLVMTTGLVICTLTNSIEISSIQFNPGGLSLSFITFVMVAFNEELMFRGYILRRLLDTRLNKWCALFISSLLFAGMHAINPNFGWLPFINLIIAGGMLGVSYLYTRNLWYPMALHLFWNWLQGPVFGFEVSGLESFNTIITQVRPVNNLLNGGSFGFEGSLLCTILMLLATTGIGYYFKQKKEFSRELDLMLEAIDGEHQEENVKSDELSL